MAGPNTDLASLDADVGPEAVTVVLRVVETMIDGLPSAAFSDDALFSQCQATMEALEAGVAAGSVAARWRAQ